MMRSRLVLALLLGLTVVVALFGVHRWYDSRQATARKVAEQSRPSLTGTPQSVAPDLKLTLLDGQEVRLRDLHGKVVLLNFWATWCPPCKAEMPDLEALYREYGDARDFIVVGVNFEEETGPVQAFVDEWALTFPVWLDSNGEAGGKLGVRGLPASFIIDREGYIRDAWNGQIARDAMLARLARVW
jgi:thiol-disulfide isomerase/thioredoxin